MDDGVIGPSGGEEAIDRPDETSQTEPQVTDHEQQADVGRLSTTLQPAAGDVVTAQPHRQSNEDESEQSVSGLGAGDRDEESEQSGCTGGAEGAGNLDDGGVVLVAFPQRDINAQQTELCQGEQGQAEPGRREGHEEDDHAESRDQRNEVARSLPQGDCPFQADDGADEAEHHEGSVPVRQP